MVMSSVPARYMRQAKRFCKGPGSFRPRADEPGHRLPLDERCGLNVRANSLSGSRTPGARSVRRYGAARRATFAAVVLWSREPKVGGLPHIVAWFARSLEASDYDLGKHPLFEPYARGVLASSYTPYFITQDQTLQQRFPQRPLKGLGPGLYWNPTLTPIRSVPLWQQRFFLDGPPPPQSQGSHTVVSRLDANVPPWYAPNSNAFLRWTMSSLDTRPIWRRTNVCQPAGRYTNSRRYSLAELATISFGL
jgi:hypothetical protein